MKSEKGLLQVKELKYNQAAKLAFHTSITGLKFQGFPCVYKAAQVQSLWPVTEERKEALLHCRSVSLEGGKGQA